MSMVYRDHNASSVMEYVYASMASVDQFARNVGVLAYVSMVYTKQHVGSVVEVRFVYITNKEHSV